LKGLERALATVLKRSADLTYERPARGAFFIQPYRNSSAA
jgi:hypothetical protein